MMNKYLEYWQLDQPAFARPVDTSRLFVPHALGLKLERLKLACEQNSALLTVTGAPGAGKSTALRWLSAALGTETHDVLLTTLVTREREPGWLTPRLAEYLGAEGAKSDLRGDQLIRATAAKLDALVQEKRRLVMMVDAAHLIASPAALDELAAFLNLQALAGSCLSFVLAGSDTLLDVLAESPELAGKIALNTALLPLSRDESFAYIEHRLRVANVKAAFDDGAVDLLHMKTKGIMAALDVAAENCLIEAFQKNLRRITAELAKIASPNLARLGGIETPKPFTGQMTLAANDDERSLSFARLAAGDPPPGPSNDLRRPTTAANLSHSLEISSDAGKGSGDFGGAGQQKAAETAAIKLSSLIKPDAAEPKQKP